MLGVVAASTHGRRLGLRCALYVGLLVVLCLPQTYSSALFTNSENDEAYLSAAAIFGGERTTPAFIINDVSSGVAADRSSSLAFGSDGRYLTSRAWPTAFDVGRYIEIDFNSPLPTALGISSATLNLRTASDSGAGTSCLYLELRRASDGGVLSTHGSSAAPLACVAGTSFSLTQVSLSAITDSTTADDLRVRVYARDSAGAAMRIDQATISGTTSYASFVLYPVQTRQLHAGGTELIRWSLAG